MTRIASATACLLLIGLTLTGIAAPAPALAAPANPFVSGSGQSAEQVRTAPKSDPSLMAPVFQALARIQARLRARLSALADQIKSDPWGAPFWAFMGLAMAYGILHALGPGHGKGFAVAYFIAAPGGLRSAMAFGYLTMFVHVLSATTLVMGGAWLLGLGGTASVDAAGGRLEATGWGVLAAMGLFMAAKALCELFKPTRAAKDESATAPKALKDASGTTSGTTSGTKTGATTSGAPAKTDLRAMLPAALGAGLAPCPGAAMVLVFTMSMGLPRVGLMSMAAISLGMGLTTSAFALAAVGSRRLLVGLPGLDPVRAARLRSLISLAGALAMAAMGGLLLAGSLMQGF